MKKSDNLSEEEKKQYCLRMAQALVELRRRLGYTQEELENVSGGTIFQSTDHYGRPIYNVYNDRTNQFVASFYSLYEAVNCNLRTNG